MWLHKRATNHNEAATFEAGLVLEVDVNHAALIRRPPPSLGAGADHPSCFVHERLRASVLLIYN